jgi:hypothetical protein
MNIGDTIDVGLVTELAGVAMVNVLYYEVIDATLGTTLEAAIEEIANNFMTAAGPAMSSAAVMSCGTWTNRDGNDPFAQQFFNIPGGGSAAAMPTQSCIRVARYGVDAGAVRQGGICVPGIDEAQVSRGRLVWDGEMGTIESFLVNDQILAAGPTLRSGFIYDVGPAPKTNTFTVTTKARTNPNVRTLRRRASRLCAG